MTMGRCAAAFVYRKEILGCTEHNCRAPNQGMLMKSLGKFRSPEVSAYLQLWKVISASVSALPNPIAQFSNFPPAKTAAEARGTSRGKSAPSPVHPSLIRCGLAYA
jgi:hypothetical protein